MKHAALLLCLTYSVWSVESCTVDKDCKVGGMTCVDVSGKKECRLKAEEACKEVAEGETKAMGDDLSDKCAPTTLCELKEQIFPQSGPSKKIFTCRQQPKPEVNPPCDAMTPCESAMHWCSKVPYVNMVFSDDDDTGLCTEKSYCRSYAIEGEPCYSPLDTDIIGMAPPCYVGRCRPDLVCEYATLDKSTGGSCKKKRLELGEDCRKQESDDAVIFDRTNDCEALSECKLDKRRSERPDANGYTYYTCMRKPEPCSAAKPCTRPSTKCLFDNVANDHTCQPEYIFNAEVCKQEVVEEFTGKVGVLFNRSADCVPGALCEYSHNDKQHFMVYTCKIQPNLERCNADDTCNNPDEFCGTHRYNSSHAWDHPKGQCSEGRYCIKYGKKDDECQSSEDGSYDGTCQEEKCGAGLYCDKSLHDTENRGLCQPDVLEEYDVCLKQRYMPDGSAIVFWNRSHSCTAGTRCRKAAEHFTEAGMDKHTCQRDPVSCNDPQKDCRDGELCEFIDKSLVDEAVEPGTECSSDKYCRKGSTEGGYCGLSPLGCQAAGCEAGLKCIAETPGGEESTFGQCKPKFVSAGGECLHKNGNQVVLDRKDDCEPTTACDLSIVSGVNGAVEISICRTQPINLRECNPDDDSACSDDEFCNSWMYPVNDGAPKSKIGICTAIYYCQPRIKENDPCGYVQGTEPCQRQQCLTGLSCDETEGAMKQGVCQKNTLEEDTVCKKQVFDEGNLTATYFDFSSRCDRAKGLECKIDASQSGSNTDEALIIGDLKSERKFISTCQVAKQKACSSDADCEAGTYCGTLMQTTGNICGTAKVCKKHLKAGQRCGRGQECERGRCADKDFCFEGRCTSPVYDCEKKNADDTAAADWCCHYKNVGCKEECKWDASAAMPLDANAEDRCCDMVKMRCPPEPVIPTECMESDYIDGSEKHRKRCCLIAGIACDFETYYEEKCDPKFTEKDEKLRHECCARLGRAEFCTETCNDTGFDVTCCETLGLKCEDTSPEKVVTGKGTELTFRFYGRWSEEKLNPKRFVRRVRLALVRVSTALRKTPKDLQVVAFGGLMFSDKLPRVQQMMQGWGMSVPESWNTESADAELNMADMETLWPDAVDENIKYNMIPYGPSPATMFVKFYVPEKAALEVQAAFDQSIRGEGPMLQNAEGYSMAIRGLEDPESKSTSSSGGHGWVIALLVVICILGLAGIAGVVYLRRAPAGRNPITYDDEDATTELRAVDCQTEDVSRYSETFLESAV